MYLVIVESPAKIKSIQSYLGNGYEVAASMGHIVDLPKSDMGVDIEHGFIPKYEVTNRKALATLKQKFSRAQGLIIATDPDREGEAIGYHVASRLGAITPTGRQKNGQKLQRIVFTSITKEAVQKAIAHPRTINFDLFNAQQARRVLDRLVGYSLSPLLWKKIRYGLSAGRVQSVALRLVVEREEEREAFKSEEYWNIYAVIQKSKVKSQSCQLEIVKQDERNQDTGIRNQDIQALKGRYKLAQGSALGKKISLASMSPEGAKLREKKGIIFELAKINNKKANIENETQARAILDKAKAQDGVITNLEIKQVKRYPKPPFTTSTLQQTAANWFGFSAKRTMQVAQKLYEAGLITYMRTDSTNLSKSAVAAARRVIQNDFGSTYLPQEANRYRTKAKVAQEAHEAIRPTDFRVGVDCHQPLQAEAKRLYTLIWQRALASQMTPAVVEQGRIEIQLIINNEKLIIRVQEKRKDLPAGKAGKTEMIRLVASSKQQAASEKNSVQLNRAPKGRQITAPAKGGQAGLTLDSNTFSSKMSSVGAAQLLFVATGQTMLFDGFLRVYPQKFEEQTLPQLKEGQQVYPKTLTGEQKFTQPPARYSEAALIKALESYGIGRPSTYVPTLSTIQNRQYVEKDGMYFFPTDTGRVVTHFLKDHFGQIVDYDFTAKMEGELDDVANGDVDWIKMMSDFYNPFALQLAQKEKKIDREDYTVLGDAPKSIKCPECGAAMKMKLGKYGRFYSCSKWPKCKGMRGEDGKSDSDRDSELKKELKSEQFQNLYQDPPKTDDGRDYLLKVGRYGKFWAHPDYPKVKDARPLDLQPAIKQKIYGTPPKASDGQAMVLRRGRFGEYWAHPDYPQVKEVKKVDRKKVAEKKKDLGVNC